MKRNLRQCVHNRGRWPVLSWPTHALQQPTGLLWWHHAILNLVCKQLTKAYPAERSCCQLRYIDWCCYMNAREYHFSSSNNIANETLQYHQIWPFVGVMCIHTLCVIQETTVQLCIAFGRHFTLCIIATSRPEPKPVTLQFILHATLNRVML